MFSKQFSKSVSIVVFGVKYSCQQIFSRTKGDSFLASYSLFVNFHFSFGDFKKGRFPKIYEFLISPDSPRALAICAQWLSGSDARKERNHQRKNSRVEKNKWEIKEHGFFKFWRWKLGFADLGQFCFQVRFYMKFLYVGLYISWWLICRSVFNSFLQYQNRKST